MQRPHAPYLHRLVGVHGRRRHGGSNRRGASGGAAGRELPTSPGGRGGLRLRREQLRVADRVGGERKRGLDLVRVRDRDRDRVRVRVRVGLGL